MTPMKAFPMTSAFSASTGSITVFLALSFAEIQPGILIMMKMYNDKGK